MNNSIWALWLTLSYEVANMYFSVGIVTALTFGVIILLRPVTNPLLEPRDRGRLWSFGWYCSYLVYFWALYGRVKILPWSFRGLLRLRLHDPIQSPTILPDPWAEGAQDTLALPGGLRIPCPLSQGQMMAIGLVWLGMVAAVLVWSTRTEGRLKCLGQQGERLPPESVAEFGLDPKTVAVRLCDGLPTSFVRRGHDTGAGDGVQHVICLQRELPPERMGLVLRHEGEHIKMHHPWWKMANAISMALFWWSPLHWAAYRLTIRDMELACDRAVLNRLEPEGRREYARMLTELAAGRHLWGSVSAFGECDAAIRIRRAAAWKPQKEWRRGLSLILSLLLILFLFTGGWAG